MSPPGISLFYAADDEATALDEMQDPGTYALAEFEILKPAPVLDLTRVPPVPSFFDAEARRVRSSILFLSQFAEEISHPIARDDRIHLEYIPTQVMTEYFRREFREAHLLGIRYVSAHRVGGICTALFGRPRSTERIFRPQIVAGTMAHRLRGCTAPIAELRVLRIPEAAPAQ